MNDALHVRTLSKDEDSMESSLKNSIRRKSFEGRGSITDSLNANLTEQTKENEKESNEVKVNTTTTKKIKTDNDESDDD